MNFNSLGGNSLGKVTKSIDFAGVLDGCQKTLSIINQAIPIIYQVKPLFSGAKTLFRIADALDNNDDKNIVNTEIHDENKNDSYVNKPIFYN